MSDRTLIASSYAAVTKSDTVALKPTVCLFIGGAGNLVVKGSDGVTATIAVLAGQQLKGRFAYVMDATTATGIVAGYSE